jgi:hypothetical protein
LNALRSLPPEEREPHLDRATAASLDPDKVHHAWQEFKRFGKVRLFANILFLYLFVIAPALIFFLGLKHCWLGLLIGLFACTVATALMFLRAHRALYPAAEDERFNHFLMILLSPATAIRAADMLSRPLLEPFHPLAVAKVFCPEARFRRLARDLFLELRHPAMPVCPRTEPVAVETERKARERVQKGVEKLLRQSGINAEEFLRPPVAADKACSLYCPRCGAQFTAGASVCEDCGGLALLELQAGTAQKDSDGRIAKPGN